VVALGRSGPVAAMTRIEFGTTLPCPACNMTGYSPDKASARTWANELARARRRKEAKPIRARDCQRCDGTGIVPYEPR
jgi:hypothetical protein